MISTKKIGFLVLSLVTLALMVLPVLTSAQESDDLPTLKIAVLPVLNTLPLYVADAEGFYAEQGINVELVPFDSARDRQIALQTEEVDGANTDLQGVILLVNGGFDVRAVRMEPIEQAYFSIVAGAESGIETIDDLRGVPIAISKNTIIEYLTTEMLLNAGFEAEDIVYEDVPQIPIRLELLNGGQVAAATLPEPLTTLSVSLQGGTLIASDADAAVVPTVLAFNSSVLEEKGELVSAFLAAYEQAVTAINADPDRFRDVMVENIAIPEPLQESYPVPTFPTAVVPSEEQAGLVMAWMVDVGLIDEPLDYDRIIDDSFLPEIAVEAPDAVGDSRLPQSLTHEFTGVGTVTIAYPEGWVAEGYSNQIIFASSQATMNKTNATESVAPEPGEVVIAVMPFPAAYYFQLGLDADATPADAASALIMLFAQGADTTLDLSDPEPFQINDRPGALITGTVTENEDIVSGAMIGAIQVEAGMGLLIVATHPDEVADLVELVQTMAGTFQLTVAGE
jgi:NitT/TauT family transport system substrate-binding protein